MKQMLKQSWLLAVLVPVLSSNMKAQEPAKKEERIIVERKGKSTGGKTIIEIDGADIRINGKPVESGNEEIIIKRYLDPEDRERIIRITSPRMRLPFGEGNEIWEPAQSRRKAELLQQRNKLAERSMQLMESRSERPLLGVQTENDSKGLRIQQVIAESAAAKAGLKEGDIITKVEGTAVTTFEQLVELIGSRKEGETISVEYLREGKKKTAKATLQALPEGAEVFRFRFDAPELPMLDLEALGEAGLQPLEQMKLFQWNSRGPRLGITIKDTEENKGVTVEAVDVESPAGKSGLQKGDLITQIDGRPISEVGDAREALQKAAGKSTYSIQLLREGKPLTVEVKFPKPLRKAELHP